MPLLSFLFLVALGVDYNIFLVTRAREEAARHGTRAGMLTALAATGGVITSAGIVLAAVFAVLGVLPLITLTQIGVIVGFGVLLDTLAGAQRPGTRPDHPAGRALLVARQGGYGTQTRRAERGAGGAAHLRGTTNRRLTTAMTGAALPVNGPPPAARHRGDAGGPPVRRGPPGQSASGPGRKRGWSRTTGRPRGSPCRRRAARPHRCSCRARGRRGRPPRRAGCGG